MRRPPLIDATTARRLVEAGHWLPEETLWTVAARHDPADVAVVCPRHGAVTFGELRAEAEHLAAAWHADGVGPGDVVVVQLPNWYDAVLAHLALTRLGAVSFPLLTSFHGRELDFVVARSGAVGIVTAPGHRSTPGERRYRELLDDRGNRLRHCWRADAGADGLRRAGPRPSDLPSPPPAGDVTMVLATSGTTGEPKMVLHSSLSTVGVKLRVAAAFGLTAGDVLHMPSPLGHATGLQNGVRLPLLLGATVVLQERWDVAEAARLVAEHGVTFSMGATPFLFDLVDLPDGARTGLRSLRSFVCGGAPIPPRLAARAVERLPWLTLMPVWGMSETDVATLVHPGDPRQKVLSSDGRPVDGWDVVVTGDDGSPAGPGEVGELRCRGAGLFHGYLGREDLTAAAMAGGWFRTGDRGTVDGDGFLRCLGRIDDFIIRGGMNIAPLEIEDLLRSHPGVRDVAVVGAPDERLGERIGAVVVPAGDPPTLEELNAHLLGLGLARTKLPEVLVTGTSLPTTPTGKVQKHLLRRQLAGGAGEDGAGPGRQAASPG